MRWNKRRDICSGYETEDTESVQKIDVIAEE